MGDVYLAHDRFLDRHVAVKFIGRMNPDPMTRARVVQEARTAARIQHPNVVSIFRIGNLDNVPYIVSEFIRGEALDRLEKPVPWRRALELGIQLARGLEAAHRHGVLHLDIKPANAILSEQDVVKLVDFGLAEFVGRGRANLIKAPAPDAARVPDSDGPTAPRNSYDSAGRAAINGLDATDLAIPAEPRSESASTARRLAAFAPVNETRTESALDTGKKNGTDTGSRRVCGTPRYMAPEVWRGERASRASDVYSLGILLYELCAGKTPFITTPMPDLGRMVNSVNAPPLASERPDVDARLAAIIDRCLRIEPDERYASGSELRDALEGLLESSEKQRIPEGNPYRGLLAFEAEHSGLFFGRRSEIGSVLQRLRSDPMVVVTGDSGAGKSSLCRAGVIPLITGDALDDHLSWLIAHMIPGRHPLDALAQALSTALAIDMDEVRPALRAGKTGFAKLLRQHLGRHRALLLFVDQFEELSTVSERDQMAQTCEILHDFTARTRKLRLLCTVRADFLVQTGNLPGIGDDVTRALYMLRPMSPDKVREAIVSPARVKGVEFESEELVDDLVRSATSSQGGLPLLQFALAELWDARASDTSRITAAALEEIGGVAGALARHADRVINGLTVEQTIAARRMLMSLVTPTGTRARRTKHELGAEEENAAAALEALVHGRLLVVRETARAPVYELAHEALVNGWELLRTWLDSHADQREAKERLERAVAEWERLGSKRAGLWGPEQLKGDASHIDRKTLGTHEQAFLEASWRAVKRSRRWRRALLIAIPALAALVYAAQVKASNDAAQAAARDTARKLDTKIAVSQHAARALYELAKRNVFELQQARKASFAAFESADSEAGEHYWAEVLKRFDIADLHFEQASQKLESTLALDHTREDVHAELGDVLYERAELAEVLHHHRIRDELIRRMAMYDRDGSRTRRWNANGRISITTTPVSATVSAARYHRTDTGRLVLQEARVIGTTPLMDVEMEPGSYLMTIDGEDRAAVRYPLLVERDRSVKISPHLPGEDEIPLGYVYIPEGRFLFGSGEAEIGRKDFLEAPPIHESSTKAFLIARYETTYAEWLEYMNTLSPEKQGRLFQNIEGGIVELKQNSRGEWQLALQIAGRLRTLKSNEPLIYERRNTHREHDWRKLPVTGMNYSDVLGYATWLDETGRLTGARPCTEREWERAARGADDRSYPHGYQLAPEEANYDETHDKDPERIGPDEVGSFPATASPFGVENMAGNILELTIPDFPSKYVEARGGAYFLVKINSRADCRSKIDPELRGVVLGFRVCASYSRQR